MPFLFWGTPLSAMDVLSEVMFAEDLAPPCRGRPKRCLKFGFHFYYINNPGKPEFWHRRFASTERPETVPTGSCRPMVSDTKSLNNDGFAHITVPTAVPACAFSLGGAAISLFWLNCIFYHFQDRCKKDFEALMVLVSYRSRTNI